MAWTLFEEIKDQRCNAQNRRYIEISNCRFDTYKDLVMPHGKHMFKIASESSMVTMGAFPSWNMHHHIINMCHVVVYNFHVLIY